jgi:hypothetical protein
MGLWQDIRGWLVPKYSPKQGGRQSPERILEFRLAGAFIALHLMIVRLPVARISPHIMMLLLCGTCPPDQQYLHAVESNAASILAPCFELMNRGSDDVDTSEVAHLLEQYLGQPVCWLSLSMCAPV